MLHIHVCNEYAGKGTGACNGTVVKYVLQPVEAALPFFIFATTVALQWLKHLWNYENMFEKLMSVNHTARPGGIIGISFLFSFTGSYVVCSHKNHLIIVILMSIYNVPFSI